LSAGLLAIAVAGIVDAASVPRLSEPTAAGPGEMNESIRETMKAALVASPADVASVLWPLVFGALTWAACMAALVVALCVLLAIVTGTLGPIDRSERASVEAGWLRVRGVALVAIAAVALASIGGQLVGVVAGGARGVDASSSGLLLLWHGWFVRSLWVAGSVLVVAGGLELWLARRQRTAALHQSVAQAREEIRQRGGRHA
jgi:hypothetical protein